MSVVSGDFGESRLRSRFASLRSEGRGGLVCFVMAGDPDFEVSLEILRGLPSAGADVIELGMPFSDPIADGPTLQSSARRALSGGQTMSRTLELVSRFRESDASTPLALMGYYNPIHRMGIDSFVSRASSSGVDGALVADLPPEADSELREAMGSFGMSFLRMATPTSDSSRLVTISRHASGFLYYVAVAGVTGSSSASSSSLRDAVCRIRSVTSLPVAAGFGIKTPSQAAEASRAADAAVIGSELARMIESGLGSSGVLSRTREFSLAVREARSSDL